MCHFIYFGFHCFWRTMHHFGTLLKVTQQCPKTVNSYCLAGFSVCSFIFVCTHFSRMVFKNLKKKSTIIFFVWKNEFFLWYWKKFHCRNTICPCQFRETVSQLRFCFGLTKKTSIDLLTFFTANLSARVSSSFNSLFKGIQIASVLHRILTFSTRNSIWFCLHSSTNFWSCLSSQRYNDVVSSRFEVQNKRLYVVLRLAVINKDSVAQCYIPLKYLVKYQSAHSLSTRDAFANIKYYLEVYLDKHGQLLSIIRR